MKKLGAVGLIKALLYIKEWDIYSTDLIFSIVAKVDRVAAITKACSKHGDVQWAMGYGVVKPVA